MLSRRTLSCAGRRAAAACRALLSRLARAQQDITFFRILTGGTVGTYFPIGGLIANAISNPPGSRPCAEGGSCGVPGLVATSVASNGSVANVAGDRGGQRAVGLRAVRHRLLGATTAPASTRAGPRSTCCARSPTSIPRASSWWCARASGIKSVPDLQAAREMSLDEPGSGTLVDARLILAAYGLSEKDLKAEYFHAAAGRPTA